MTDLTGNRYGRLQVLWPAGLKKAGCNRVMWACQCDCGRVSAVVQHALTRPVPTRSCGCLRVDCGRKMAPINQRFSPPKRTTHGHTRGSTRGGAITPEYRAWVEAKKRCVNPATAPYKYYGGRGIEFRFDDFLSFYREVGDKPRPKHLYSLDRINVNGHYEPGNVRWATWKEQRANRRDSKGGV